MSCSLLIRRIVTILVIVSTVGLTSCALSPERSILEPISTTASREKLALDLQDKGELAEALVQWTILSTIEPANGHYGAQIAATKQLIDRKSKPLMLEGVTNLRRGVRDTARLSFLKVLALNPKNKEALEYLRQLTMQSPNAWQYTSEPDGRCCRNRGSNVKVKE